MQDDGDALRFRADLPEGRDQDQALGNVRAGLVRGASLEMTVSKQSSSKRCLRRAAAVRDLEAQVLRLSLVDDGAYSQAADQAARAAGGDCSAGPQPPASTLAGE